MSLQRPSQQLGIASFKECTTLCFFLSLSGDCCALNAQKQHVESFCTTLKPYHVVLMDWIRFGLQNLPSDTRRLPISTDQQSTQWQPMKECFPEFCTDKASQRQTILEWVGNRLFAGQHIQKWGSNYAVHSNVASLILGSPMANPGATESPKLPWAPFLRVDLSWQFLDIKHYKTIHLFEGVPLGVGYP